MSSIDIGSPAVNGDGGIIGPRTVINRENPANAYGTITMVQIYCGTSLVGCKVATFEEISPNYFTTRATEYIGAVASGATRTFEVTLDVRTGDFIGIYFSAGNIDVMLTTPVPGYWRVSNDYIPCTNQDFGDYKITRIVSLYGEGEYIPPQKDRSRTGIYTFKTLK